ncbi:MAG: chromosomal replication initiator protein DnaA [Pseudomonadota bacterium]
MEKLWNETLDHLKAEVSDHAFRTWLAPIQYRNTEENHFVLEVPNNFFRERVQQAYADMIRTKLRLVSHSEVVDVSFVTPPKTAEPSLLRDISRAKKELTRQERPVVEAAGLNSRYAFESFVVGTSNQFAHAAALAVAQAPGKTYNPLFIYGGVGLGKTHLLCAIGQYAAEHLVGCRIVYRTAERFMNELINAIRYEKMPEFRSRYRQSCDVLLVDDIQFLAGKERTQEEFFHTFNALYEANKQIVLTSDRYPKEIPDLDERLRSRFQCGLFADIQPPDVETRVAILKKKSERDHVELPDPVAFYLANRIKSNVRVLEGALIRLAAFASISRRPITLELTQEVFGTLAPEDKSLSIETIQKRVAEFFNLSTSDLKSARRHKVVALPRQIAMYLSRKLTQASFPELGERFGGKDHTTVMHAVNKIDRLLAEDSPVRNSVATIEQTLQSDL